MINDLFKLASQFEALAAEKSKSETSSQSETKPEKKEKLPPKSSNLKEILSNIESLQTFSARKEYAEKCLKQIASGSSRVVFEAPKDVVVKLAFNDKGLAQNKAEASIKDDCKYLNLVTKNAKDYSWVITPLAKKITEREFYDKTGINFKEFGECVKYAMRELSTKERTKPEDFDKISQEAIFKEIVEIGLKYKLMPGDIARISSWKIKDDVPVLVDLGLTQEIYKKFYAKKKTNS
jgi:uncharacterized FlaG/YvyC family protein